MSGLPNPIELNVVRYAQLHPDGNVMRCGPTHEEKLGKTPVECRRLIKVVYPDWGSAELATDALEHIGADPMYPYKCKRFGGKVHYHLATVPGAKSARRKRDE